MNNITRDQMMTVLMGMELSLDEKLAYHFAKNFGRPLPKGLIATARQAIMLDSYGFDWETTMVKLPIGSWFHGEQEAPLGKFIEAHHLEWFLKDTEDNGRKMSDAGFTIEDTTQ